MMPVWLEKKIASVKINHVIPEVTDHEKKSGKKSRQCVGLEIVSSYFHHFCFDRSILALFVI